MKELLLKRKKAFSIYLIACLFPVVSQILSALVISLIIGSVGHGSLDAFYRAILIGIGFVFFTSTLFVISRFLRIRFMRDTILDVRIQAFDKIMRSSFESFSSKSKEVYVSNLINDINLFEQNFFIKLLNIIFLGGTYTVALLVLLVLDYKFALGVFFISIVVFTITRLFESKTVSLQEEVSTLNESFTVDAANTINGMEILKLNRIEKPFLEKTLKTVDRVEKKKMFFGIFVQGQRGVNMLLGTIAFVGILLYLLSRINEGMSYTELAFMVQVSNACVWPLQQIMPLMNELKASVKIYNKITQDECEHVVIEEGTEGFNFSNRIEVDQLSFAYDDKSILDNVSFSLEKGKKYLLRGVSGSGKSTLVKVLSKTLQAYEGNVLIDGVPLRNIESNSFNSKVAFIYQDVFLFEDTLLNNVTLFEALSEEEVMEAIEKSGLTDVVQNNPNGLNQVLNENGKNLSGGQRQRVSIARAICKNAELLFADEATSSLNHELGAMIEKALLDLECTVVSVSHRFYEGITDRYDYVLEMKNGTLKQIPASVYFKEVKVA